MLLMDSNEREEINSTFMCFKLRRFDTLLLGSASKQFLIALEHVKTERSQFGYQASRESYCVRLSKIQLNRQQKAGICFDLPCRLGADDEIDKHDSSENPWESIYIWFDIKFNFFSPESASFDFVVERLEQTIGPRSPAAPWLSLIQLGIN